MRILNPIGAVEASAYFPRRPLFARRGLSKGRDVRPSDHAGIEYGLLPGLSRCPAAKVCRAGYPLGSRRRPNHRAGDLVLPCNISALFLPPYAPELNPKENLWDEIREKIFKNRALKSIGTVRAKLRQAILSRTQP
ncbi:MAG: transposase [Methylocella sp.]